VIERQDKNEKNLFHRIILRCDFPAAQDIHSAPMLNLADIHPL